MWGSVCSPVCSPVLLRYPHFRGLPALLVAPGRCRSITSARMSSASSRAAAFSVGAPTFPPTLVGSWRRPNGGEHHSSRGSLERVSRVAIVDRGVQGFAVRVLPRPAAPAHSWWTCDAAGSAVSGLLLRFMLFSSGTRGTGGTTGLLPRETGPVSAVPTAFQRDGTRGTGRPAP